jgi:hypothetical protein
LIILDKNLHFFTYFSKEYLIQGSVAIESFISHHSNSTGYVVSLDAISTRYLQECGFPDSLKIMELSDLMDINEKFSDLLETRTYAEAIITLKPFLVENLLKKIPEGDYLLYFDADLFFYQSLISELSFSDSVHMYLSRHLFPPRMLQSVVFGKYNGGFFLVRNIQAGRSLILDWRKKCDYWCFLRLEDGKFADQKYLDHYYPAPGVVQIDSPGINNGQYFFQVHRNIVSMRSSGSIWIEHKLLTCFHFHGFRINQSIISTGFNRYRMPKNFIRVVAYIYLPYIRHISKIASRYEAISEVFWQDIGTTPERRPLYRSLIKTMRFTIIPRKFIPKGSHDKLI